MRTLFDNLEDEVPKAKPTNKPKPEQSVVRSFRAVRNSDGKWDMQSSKGGPWVTGLIVLEKADAIGQLDRLRNQGCIVVDSDDLKLPKRKGNSL
jgi:hypothetical protein